MRSILIAAAVAMLVSLFITPATIRLFRRRGYGQIIQDELPASQHIKHGTPTMGGTVIIVAFVVGYLAPHVIFWRSPTTSGLLVLFLSVGLGLVGFVDDFIKIFKQRSLGLRSKAKLAGQSLVAIVFAVLALQFPDPRTELTPASPYISFIRDITPLKLVPVLFVIWAYLIIAAASNGVNLTDGLDGLATGACAMIFGAYLVMTLWQFTRACENITDSRCYQVRDPYDLAVVSAALAGACFGFLWWNASPARMIMGDTGSLALGGAIAGLAILSRTQLLLVVMGGLLLIESLSVIIQVGNFKFWKWRTGTGRRIFRMSPIHYHFQLKGWGEVTIVIRFWIICGLCVGAALGIFYAEWITG
jgi:phospho-N-acetylmuramoyl-pentapeptide-transferase